MNYSSAAVYPLHGVNSVLFDLHHQMAEQYRVYPAATPTVHTLSVAERLAGRPPCSCIHALVIWHLSIFYCVPLYTCILLDQF